MPEQDWDPVWKFRAPKTLVERFDRVAKTRGRNRSTMLRDYMRRVVAEDEGRRGRTGDTPTPDQDHDG